MWGSKSSQKPLVSVVIPTYNGHKTIVQCLETVTQQVTSFPYEVIVVDSSPEPMEPLIKPRFPQVRYIHSKQRLSAGEARNLGITLSQGDYIAFVDCDVLLPADWLSKMVRRLEQNSEIAGIGCAILNGNNRSLTAWIVHLAEFSRFLPSRKSLKVIEAFPTAACCFHKSVLQQVRFPQTLGAGGEDPAFCFLLKRRGKKLFCDLTVPAFHLTPSGWKAIFRKPFSLGKSEGFVVANGFETRGKLFARYPLLLLAYPFLRTIYSWWHCAQASPKYAVLFMVLSPFIFASYCAWAWGIYCGAREARRR